MPYIITTLNAGSSPTIESRRAVATLDEARDYLGTMNDDDREWNEWCREIGEHGGTVGPLPDGTVIEVERVEWRDIGDALETAGINVDTLDGSAIDAYNAAQSCES